MTEAKAGFVAALAGRAAQAAQEVGSRSLDLAPGGIGVRVHLVGDRVAHELEPGLLQARAVVEPAIELWSFDHASSGIVPPPAPWSQDAYRHREEIAGWTERPLFASFDTAHATLSAADTTTGTGVQWARDAAAYAPWEGGAPLRYLLRWLLAEHAMHLVHGAVVGTDRGGVLLVGKAGAGKSTTSLACIDAGMRFVADDYFLLAGGERPVAYPLFAIAKADDHAVGLLGQVAERAEGAARDWRGKFRLPVSDVISDSLAIRGIVQPRRAAGTGVPVPRDWRESLKEIVTSSLSQMPGASAATLAALRPAFERLPCFELPVGPDVDRISVALTALIEDLARGS